MPQRLRVSTPYVMITLTLAAWLTGPAGLRAAGPAADPAASRAAVVIEVGTEPGAAFASVQAAVDAAPAGAVVRIGPGTFAGPVKIDKPLTLEGAGWDRTTIAVERPTEEEFDEFLRVDALLKAWWGEEGSVGIRLALRDAAFPSVLRIDAARGVTVRNLKASAWAELPSGERGVSGWTTVARVSRAAVRFERCALVGSPGDGILIVEGSDVEVRNSLVAATGGTGIRIGPHDWKAWRDRRQLRRAPGDARDPAAVRCRVTVADCDVRNCHYAGITVGPGHEATIERCRISGAAWHGIRYDDASPTITGNRIFANARCGIYASGKTAATVTDNLFTGNEMVGMCCWKANGDMVAGNTFAGNTTGALSVSNASRPRVERNVFFGHPVALTTFGDTGRASAAADPARPWEPAKPVVADPDLRANIFWGNPPYERITMTAPLPAEVAAARAARVGNPQPVPEPVGETKRERVPLDESADNRVLDPRFTDPEGGGYVLAADSPARAAGIGAADPLTADSPWPLQPEERAIIPDGPSRDFQLWKRAPHLPRR